MLPTLYLFDADCVGGIIRAKRISEYTLDADYDIVQVRALG
jgi:hypothetical protein